MNTTALPGQLAFADSVKPWRSIGAKPGERYKIVTIQVAAPADMSDDEIVEATNFALTNTYVDEAAPLAHDGAIGDNDHFREAVVPTDDLFAGAPQAIFENWYLIPDGSTSSPTNGVQCPQCEKFFTAPEDTAAIGDHALCTACLTAWRMTAAAKDDGDGYSEQPPFLPIPEWWTARGLAVPTGDILPGTSIEDLEYFASQIPTNTPANEAHPLMVRRYFSAQTDDFTFAGPFESEEAACLHWPANDCF